MKIDDETAISDFHTRLREFLHALFPNARSANAIAVEASSRTGMACETIRRIYLGRTLPHRKTFESLMRLSRDHERSAIRPLYDRIETYMRTRKRRRALPSARPPGP